MADLYEFAFFVIGAACSWAIFFEVVSMRRLLLLLVLVSSSVSAEEYYWYMGYFDKKVSSPSAGCDLYFTGISRDQGGFLLWSLRQIQVRRARFSIVWFVLVIGFFLIRLFI
ncbi:hypothetical protein [Pseudomonas aeruginosa]|uniref:hypothetical protein n=1 Tax=Pseudomonas aeruginosa TaxID=287 RepID=UPI0021B15EEB|nr:hypothetical protein [Pseudomonas aeruginosa]MCT7418364.1 hypothetical protein [Pseudomonas aeruginosa]